MSQLWPEMSSVPTLPPLPRVPAPAPLPRDHDQWPHPDESVAIAVVAVNGRQSRPYWQWRCMATKCCSPSVIREHRCGKSSRHAYVQCPGMQCPVMHAGMQCPGVQCPGMQCPDVCNVLACNVLTCAMYMCMHLSRQVGCSWTSFWAVAAEAPHEASCWVLRGLARSHPGGLLAADRAVQHAAAARGGAPDTACGGAPDAAACRRGGKQQHRPALNEASANTHHSRGHGHTTYNILGRACTASLYRIKIISVVVGGVVGRSKCSK